MSYQFGFDQNVKDYVDGKLKSVGAFAPVDYVANVFATNTLTDGNATNVTALDTVVVNGKTYTFQTAAAVEGDVKRGANADASLLNLARAINNSGGTPGTDYVVAAAHPTVSSSASVTSNAVTLTAKVAGAAGNALTLVGSTHMTAGAATFSSGVTTVPGTVGTVGDMAQAGGVVYICLTNATATSQGAWKRISTAGL